MAESVPVNTRCHLPVYSRSIESDPIDFLNCMTGFWKMIVSVKMFLLYGLVYPVNRSKISQ